MKYLTTAVLLLIAMLCKGQNSCGVYASRADFMNNKVTYAFDDCEMKVRLDKDIVALHQEMKLRFDFSFIFGYSDGKNLYRAYALPSLVKDAGYYKIIYDGDVVIYERIRRDYRSNPQAYYYFSLTKDSRIMPLKTKFYSTSARKTIRVNLSALKQFLNIDILAGDPAFTMIEVEMEKKKPDISARLQTTTRRPKVL